MQRGHAREPARRASRDAGSVGRRGRGDRCVRSASLLRSRRPARYLGPCERANIAARPSQPPRAPNEEPVRRRARTERDAGAHAVERSPPRAARTPAQDGRAPSRSARASRRALSASSRSISVSPRSAPTSSSSVSVSPRSALASSRSASASPRSATASPRSACMSPRSATASPGVDRVTCVVGKTSPVIADTVVGSRRDIAGNACASPVMALGIGCSGLGIVGSGAAVACCEPDIGGTCARITGGSRGTAGSSPRIAGNGRIAIGSDTKVAGNGLRPPVMAPDRR